MTAVHLILLGFIGFFLAFGLFAAVVLLIFAYLIRKAPCMPTDAAVAPEVLVRRPPHVNGRAPHQEETR